MKRRVISLLAMVAMLCTMVVFAMPATVVAATEDTALSSILGDIASGGAALNALAADADEAAIIVAATTDKGSISWKDFAWGENDYPRYAYHKVYEAAGYTLDKWSISKQEDWEAMREVADSVNASIGNEGKDAPKDSKGEYVDYFVGTEFHLTDNVSFAYTDTSDERLKPMGYSFYEAGGGFAGTINGHGYSFENVFVYALKAWAVARDADGNIIDVNKDGAANNNDVYPGTSMNAGLFQRLANCTFIDFGLEGGVVYQNTAGAGNCVSSFGTVLPNRTPTFERVWSSITIAPACNAQACGLVGSFSDQAITVNVNGFVYDGEIIKSQNADHSQQLSFAIYSSGGSFFANNNDFYNIITDFSSRNGKYNGFSAPSYSNDELGTAALFAFTAEEAFLTSTIENVYAVKRAENGIDDAYAINATLGGRYADSLLTDMSAAEAAWTINQNPSKSATPVYFKLNEDGKVRPIPGGKTDGMIVGITVEIENITKNVCVNPGSIVDLKAVLGYNGNVNFQVINGNCTIADDGITATVGNGNATVKMTNPCVEHDFRYNKVNGDNKHTVICSVCNHQVIEACKLINCTYNEETEWNAYTHTGTCVCGNVFSEVCHYEYDTDNGCKYVCSCGRTADAAAPMVAGDVNESGSVDLIDAVQLLKIAVGMTVTINERNADVDGNNAPDVKDAYKIILYFMKNKATKLEFEAIQNRVNEANYFNVKNISYGNLKMDGTEGTNLRYIRTNHIKVSAGNKIVFGPVRKTQAVLGHFYDKDGNPLELININNERLNVGEKAEHVFKAEVKEKEVTVNNKGESATIGDVETKVVDGLEMVSIVAPEGAAYVRLQANAQEEEKFYIRINNEFSLADYQCRTNGDANTLTNKERGQLFLTVGDSLCTATDDKDATLSRRGWQGRIIRDFGAEIVNTSQGGAAFSSLRFINMFKTIEEKQDSGVEDDALLRGDGFTQKQSIVNQINMQRDSGRQLEYVLLEGGGNDASMTAKLKTDFQYEADFGYISESYDPSTFAPMNTYLGGFERAIYSALKNNGDTAAFGYMSAYAMPEATNFKDSGRFFEVVQDVCDKWKIPCLDIYTELENFDTTVYTADKIHANTEGHDILNSYIHPFVHEEMRPADQDILLEIQQYEDIEVSWFELAPYSYLFE